MNVVTIPKRITGARDDLVVLPRREYEALLARPDVKEFTPTKADVRALERARKDFRAGKFVPWEDVKRDLEARR